MIGKAPRHMRMFALSASACLLALSAHASAQWTGSRIGGNIRKADAGELMQLTARCIAERGPDYARELLETLPGTDAEFKLIRRNAGDIEICMDNSTKAVGSVEMSFSPRPFRRALAAEMLTVELRSDVNHDAMAAGESWYLAKLENLPEDEKVDLSYMAYFEFGDCVVKLNPTAAVGYLQTKEGSKKEGTALGALQPSLSPCVQAGSNLQLTHEALRVALTEPTYHRLRAASLETSGER